jgi:hypothetical protein
MVYLIKELLIEIVKKILKLPDIDDIINSTSKPIITILIPDISIKKSISKSALNQTRT